LPRGDGVKPRRSVIRDAAENAAQTAAPRTPRAKPAATRAKRRSTPPAQRVDDRATVDDTARDPLGDGGWEPELPPPSVEDDRRWREGAAQSTGFDANRSLAEWLEEVIPPEAQAHFAAAGKEFAAGVQATVEHHLGRSRSERQGPTRIEIE
jgi:hypothetical protein